jgi:uncharacterized protein YcfJ
MCRRAGLGLMLAAAVLLAVLPACQWTQEHPKLATGAAVGAAGGAIAGGLIGGTRKGVIWGGLLGALAGGAVGAYMDHQDNTAAETNAAHNYTADQGVQLQIVSVTADPQSVVPGKDVALKVKYAVMAPDPQQQITVTEKRVVNLNGEKMADHSTEVARTPGTWTSTLPITLPETAPKGTYQVEVTVTVGGQSTSMTTSFAVQ